MTQINATNMYLELQTTFLFSIDKSGNYFLYFVNHQSIYAMLDIREEKQQFSALKLKSSLQYESLLSMASIFFCVINSKKQLTVT